MSVNINVYELIYNATKVKTKQKCKVCKEKNISAFHDAVCGDKCAMELIEIKSLNIPNKFLQKLLLHERDPFNRRAEIKKFSKRHNYNFEYVNVRILEIYPNFYN